MDSLGYPHYILIPSTIKDLMETLTKFTNHNVLKCKCGEIAPIKTRADRTYFTCKCGYSALVFGSSNPQHILAGYSQIKK